MEAAAVTKFVSIDLETGGLDPRLHPITEVGMVIEKPLGKGGFVTEEVTFSLPFARGDCEEDALRIQRYDSRKDMKDYPEQWEPARAIGFLAKTLSGAHIIGKNPSFDIGFLNEFFYEFAVEPTWHHRAVDVGPLVWGWYTAKKKFAFRVETPFVGHPPNTELVAQMVGIPLPEDERHAALADARWAYDVFRAVVFRG